MIEPMAKIEIVGLMDELDTTLDLLQSMGTTEIIEIPTIEETGHCQIHRIHLDKRKEDLLAGYEELLSTVTELLDILNVDETEGIAMDTELRLSLQGLDPSGLAERISGISREIRRLGRKRKNLQEDLESTRQYETLINTFLPLLEQAGPIGQREQIGIILKKGETAVLPVLKNRIDEITGDDTLVLNREMPEGEIGVYIVVGPGDLATVRELLGNEGVAEYHIPRQYRKKSLNESIELIRERIVAIPGEVAEIDDTLNEQKRSHGSILRFMQSISTDRINQLRILPKLIRTGYTFAVSAWTPISSLKKLEGNLNDRFGDRVYVGRVRITDLDMVNIPTLLSNRRVFRSFEVLMKLLPPPKYDNIDATAFITVFFPLFFGIILGDMAYGLVLMGLAGLLRWRVKRPSVLADVGIVAMTAGFFTVVFGFLYGEFLGDLGELHFGLRPLAPWLHRATAIEVMLILSIAIGVVHVGLGFALKTYISFAMRHTKGVLEGIAKIVVILGAVGVFTQLFLELPVAIRHVSFGLIGTGVAGVAYTEGFFGLIELMSMFGNILSYSRIMAVGIASVILAIVANRLAEASPNIFLAVLIGFMVHLLNFVIGIFSPTIHSLRLHYVEFFAKFFNSSGRLFKPFRKIMPGGE